MDRFRRAETSRIATPIAVPIVTLCAAFALSACTHVGRPAPAPAIVQAPPAVVAAPVVAVPPSVTVRPGY